MTDTKDEGVKQTCLCGNVEVLVLPGIELTGLRCWLCPTEYPPKPTLRLVKG